jgi:phosphoglycolate phosphatase
MTYHLAIFDFDGTLADSFPFFLSVFNTLADQHGFKRIDTTRAGQFRHYDTRRMMDHIGLPAWKLPLVARSFQALMKDSAYAIPLFTGIDGALRHLASQGMKLAVVSSNSEHNVRQVLGPDLTGLIAQFECGMSIFGKASRIRAVLKDCGVAANEAIYIGDQATDAEASRKAGVAFGAVHWGYAAIEALRAAGCAHEFSAPDNLRGIVIL